MSERFAYYCFNKRPASRGVMTAFTDQFSSWYFRGNDCILSSDYQSSIWAEKAIMSIKDRGIQSPKDVFYILAWKIGGIDHKSCDKNHPIVLREGWSYDGSSMAGVHRGKNINNIGELASFVAERINTWQNEKKSINWSKEDALRIINEIDTCKREKNVTQIGSVYIITLLFFITQGEFPVYDQEAMKALLAIKGGKMPGSKVDQFNDMLDISSPNFWNRYQDYINLLEKFFGTDYKTERKIDQALWVYGHLFKRDTGND